jgi:hypothetical protein
MILFDHARPREQIQAKMMFKRCCSYFIKSSIVSHIRYSILHDTVGIFIQFKFTKSTSLFLNTTHGMCYMCTHEGNGGPGCLYRRLLHVLESLAVRMTDSLCI